MNSKIITAMEARAKFGEILNRVALLGENYTIERAGKPLAKVVPVKGRKTSVDPFENSFATFTEWLDPSNDAYDTL